MESLIPSLSMRKATVHLAKDQHHENKKPAVCQPNIKGRWKVQLPRIDVNRENELAREEARAYARAFPFGHDCS